MNGKWEETHKEYSLKKLMSAFLTDLEVADYGR